MYSLLRAFVCLLVGIGDGRGLSLEMIHETPGRLSDHFHQQDNSQSSSFAAYDTASVSASLTLQKYIILHSTCLFI